MERVRRAIDPIWVGELDLLASPTSLSGEVCHDSQYCLARLLVRLGPEPVGLLTVGLEDGAYDVQSARREAARRFRTEIDAVGGQSWTPEADCLDFEPAPWGVAPEEMPAISVVIGTRNRPEKLIECIQLVLKQDYPSSFEVIAVDNGASDNATAEALDAHFARDDRVRYMSESRPGLSRARNIGLAAAQYPITAFLSDDIRVEPNWLRAVARGFARDPEIWMVTGFCPPLYLDNRETQMFEASMSWGTRQGFVPTVYEFDHAEDRVHPYRAANFINGSNMIYRTSEFRAMGGFDESLGPGTIARGGEDLDAPVRILTAGGKIAFEPAVVGWHADRYDDRPFDQHMYTYGLGLTAFLAKHLADPSTRRALVSRIPAGLPMLLHAFGEPDQDLVDRVPIPLRYHLWHHAGRLVGPFAYFRSRRARRS